MVKQEMARENVDVLGNSELTWTGIQMSIVTTTVGKTLLE